MTDTIERTITIDAPLARVWDLATEPGWWVDFDAGAPGDRSVGATTVRHHRDDAYPVRVVAMEPMSYAAFRWASMFAGDDVTDANSTLIEFRLREVDGGVQVQVVESGFDAVEATPEQRAAGHRDNSGGWAECFDTLLKRAQS